MRRQLPVKVLCGLLVSLASLLMFNSLAQADIAPRPANGGQQIERFRDGMVSQTRVAMVHEIVKLKVSRDRCEVHVVFTMKNTGEADETMPVGFPANYEGELESFSAAVNGKPVKAADKTTTRTDDRIEYVRERHTYWKLWTMTFPAMQDVKVEVKYSTRLWQPDYVTTLSYGGTVLPLTSYNAQGKRDPEVAREFFERLHELHVVYVLTTGRDWFGPIGHCQVEIDFQGISTDYIVPTHPRFPGRLCIESPQRAVWEKKNFEPTHNIGCTLTPGITSQHVDDYLTEQLRRAPDDLSLLCSLAALRQSRDRQAEAEELVFKAIYSRKDRVAFWGPTASNTAIHDAGLIWELITNCTIDAGNPKLHGIDMTDKARMRKLAPIMADIARQLDAQAAAADVESRSAKSMRPQFQAVIQWCQRHDAKADE